MTDQLLKKFKLKISSLKLAPYGDGRFEVIKDGELIFSKHKLGRFPEYEEIEAGILKS